MIVSTESNSVIIFQDWVVNRIYLDQDPSSPYFTKGYLSPQPSANEITLLFEKCEETTENNNLFTVKRSFLEQLEETEDNNLRYEFLAKMESDGVCLNFTAPIKLKNTSLNVIELKFNTEFE